LLGLHDLGNNFMHWWLVDVLWATAAGLATGGLLGTAAAWAMHRLAARGMQSEFMENFLGLGLLALAYGLALLLHSYGFLAVFAAGFMLHRTEAKLGWSESSPSEAATRQVGASGHAPYMARVSLHLVEQLERLAEVAILILMGGMLFADSWQPMYVAVAVVLLFIVRPLSVFAGLIGSGHSAPTLTTVAWFGVRGIGSLYYLMYAIQHGLPEEQSVTLVSLVLIVVVISIVLHGASVTPVMRWYARRLPP
jgi:NhaP-type Na+/H+ or K+/H+ antiporter